MKLRVVNNERPDLCGPCGGACCKAGPGIIDPKDMGPNVAAAVRQAVGSGRFKVGWDKPLDGGGALFLAPATVDADSETIDFASPSRPCSLLTEKGCSLQFAERPRQCRDLIARPPRESFFDLGCTLPTGKDQDFYVALWKGHQAELLAVLSPSMVAIVSPVKVSKK